MGASIESRPIIGWIASYNAIEIIRISLCFHEALLTTFGAADIVRVVGGRAIESFGYLFGIHSCQVQGAVPEIFY